MKYFLLLPLLFLFACENAGETTTQPAATPEATSSAPAPAATPGGLQPPYPITDSSNIFTVDGIQIYIAEMGNGPKPKPGSNVVMNYRGTLLNGEEFDSSFGRGGYQEFSLGALIQGWQIALPQVPTGSKVKLIIPSDKAYGPAARPGIPANSTLIFDIDLVSSY